MNKMKARALTESSPGTRAIVVEIDEPHRRRRHDLVRMHGSEDDDANRGGQ